MSGDRGSFSFVSEWSSTKSRTKFHSLSLANFWALLTAPLCTGPFAPPPHQRKFTKQTTIPCHTNSPTLLISLAAFSLFVFLAPQDPASLLNSPVSNSLDISVMLSGSSGRGNRLRCLDPSAPTSDPGFTRRSRYLPRGVPLLKVAKAIKAPLWETVSPPHSSCLNQLFMASKRVSPSSATPTVSRDSRS